MPEHLTDHFTDKEINILKGIASYDLNSYYYDNTFVINRPNPIISDTCISFKKTNSWLSIGTRTTGPNGFKEYEPLRVFENKYPKEHPNIEIDNPEFVPNTQEIVNTVPTKLVSLFVYSITQTYVDLTAITYDCGICINFDNNTQLFIYADSNSTMGIHVSTNKADIIEEYNVSYLSNLNKRQVI